MADEIAAPMEPLHLVTQRNQPPFSRRRSCENCGRMCWAGMPGSAQRWTDDPDVWAAALDNCEKKGHVNDTP